MNELLIRYSRLYVDRVDALPPRQRLMVFAVALLILAAAGNLLFLDPAWAKQKQLAQRVEQQQKDLVATQAQLRAVTQKGLPDPDAANRTKLASLRERLSRLDAEMQELQQGLVEPSKMAALLEQMMSRQKGLELVGLRTLPVGNVAEKEDTKAPAGPQAPTPAPGASPSTLIYKHGIEITVKGKYLDLLEYLARLEKLSSRMYWGKAVLKVEAYPKSTLTLTVYTLSLDKTWLVV